MTSRIQESFHLFFNSTPPADARMAFDLDDNDNDGDSSGDAAVNVGALPLGYIHVRGAGTNQFGTFEIIGGYNVKTGVLSCQRIYVTTTDGDAKAEREKNKEKAKESVSTPMRKSYFTRKRPVSFKRPGYGNRDGADEGKKRMGGGSAKKRPRVAPPEQTPSKDDTVPAIVTTASASASILPTAVAVVPAAIPPAVPSLPPVTIMSPPVKAPAPVAAVAKPTARRPSPNRGSSRKPKSSPQSGGRSGQLTNAFHIPIPKVGNAQEARWRSAHYLYYVRHADETSSNSPSNSATNPVAPAKSSYVVYEGEMNGGHNIRDGKGVCLYNNNMIYEGEWKKNKEHGYGSLFNGDRSQTIYVGEWERGKMVSLCAFIC